VQVAVLLRIVLNFADSLLEELHSVFGAKLLELLGRSQDSSLEDVLVNTLLSFSRSGKLSLISWHA
jgi:hypothetical protein